MTDTKREFQRLFEFVVKYYGEYLPFRNGDIKKFLRWAWFYKKLFVVFDGPRIAAVGVAWRTDHPENNYEDLSIDKTEIGDFLNVYCVIVHPDYRRRGLMFQLLTLALTRFRGVKKVFWTKRTPSDKIKIIIKPVEVIFEELYRWERITKPHNHQKSKLKA